MNTFRLQTNLQQFLNYTNICAVRPGFILITLLILCVLNVDAHDRNCIAHDIHLKKQMSDPAYLKSRLELEKFTETYVENYFKKEKNNSSNQRTGVITIPVVFHVIHNGEAIGTGTNIAEAQLISQLQVLNEDFRKLNANRVNIPLPFQNAAADCEIEFCLALQDPQGNPAIGIERINGGQPNWDFQQMENFKPTIAWDPNRYLNFYTADITPIGAIGFATFPVFPIPLNDGIVCDFRTVGRAPANPFGAFLGGAFNQGRTATHEVGHWLNIFHIWGDDGNLCNGSDQVFDTPNQGGPNFGCPMFPRFSCGNLPNGDMFMNFMDLSNDICMNIFTNGQKARMSATFDNVRTGLNSNLCTRKFVASNITAATATLTWSPFVGAIGYNVRWRILGGNGIWNQINNSPVNTVNIVGLMPFPAAYEWQVQPIFNNGPGAFTASELFRTLALAPPVPCPNDPNENAVFGPYLTNGTQAQGIICPAMDIDRFVIMNNMPGGSTLRLILSNLALDYDIELRDAVTNNLISSSNNIGTQNDTIKYLNFQPGNYYVYVFAKMPGLVNVQPYTIRMLQLAPGTMLPPGFRSIKELKENVKIYPNPAANNATIELNNAIETDYTFSIYDISGSTLRKFTQKAEPMQRINIDLSELHDGMYFIDVSSDKERFIEKLIIKN